MIHLIITLVFLYIIFGNYNANGCVGNLFLFFLICCSGWALFGLFNLLSG